jgi:transposase
MASSKQIRERRQRVRVMLCKGMHQKDVAEELKMSQSTISYDVRALEDKSEQALNDSARETLPFIFEKCMDGIREVIKECRAIYHNTDNKEISQWHRLSTLRLAKDSQIAIFDLVSQGPTVMTVKKLQEQIKE